MKPSNPYQLLSTLIAGWGVAVAGCGFSPATSTGTQQHSTPSPPVYAVTWKFCADAADALVGADESGCVQNRQPLYLWGSEDNTQPHGVLLRTSVPTRLNPHVRYQVALFSRGCYGQHPSQPSLPSYYSAGRTLMLEKNFANDRATIPTVVVTTRRVEDSDRLAQLANSDTPATFGDRCLRLDPSTLPSAS